MPSVTFLCHLISTVWQYVSPLVIVKDFKKFCMCTALGGSDISWNDSDEAAVSVRKVSASLLDI
jgi:hypothetical protein